MNEFTDSWTSRVDTIAQADAILAGTLAGLRHPWESRVTLLSSHYDALVIPTHSFKEWKLGVGCFMRVERSHPKKDHWRVMMYKDGLFCSGVGCREDKLRDVIESYLHQVWVEPDDETC